jgi:hypothetical protein
MAQYEFNPAAINPEAIRDLMRQVGGTNLAGQSMAGPVATGQAYAQQIAGGMPMEQVIAPGVSYSPEQAGGYTQADLDLQNRFIGEGPVLVMPKAPTKGTPFAPNEGFVQMPSAPQGVAQPTKFMPFLQDLDFSGLPRYEDIRDIRGIEDIRPTLFDFDVDEILKNIDTEKFEDIDFSNIDIPSVAPMMPELPDFSNRGESVATSFMPGGDSITDFLANQGVATDRESLIGKTLFGQTITPESFGGEETAKSSFLSAVPRPDLPIPNISGPFGFMNKPTPAPVIPQVPVQEPMNFTGLPQMPVIPNIPVMPELPVMPQPIVQQPIMPMNFTRLSNLPVSNFVQPSVDEIVRPITRQGKFLLQQPGLFNLV